MSITSGIAIGVPKRVFVPLHFLRHSEVDRALCNRLSFIQFQKYAEPVTRKAPVYRLCLRLDDIFLHPIHPDLLEVFYFAQHAIRFKRRQN